MTRDHNAAVFPLVAQLDNAADYDSEERGFESLQAGHDYLPIWHQDLKLLDIQGVSAFLEGVFSSDFPRHQIS